MRKQGCSFWSRVVWHVNWLYVDFQHSFFESSMTSALLAINPSDCWDAEFLFVDAFTNRCSEEKIGVSFGVGYNSS